MLLMSLSTFSWAAEKFSPVSNPKKDAVHMQYSAVPYVMGYISIGSMLIFTGLIISDALSTTTQDYEARPVIESEELIHDSLHRARNDYN